MTNLPSSRFWFLMSILLVVCQSAVSQDRGDSGRSRDRGGFGSDRGGFGGGDRGSFGGGDRGGFGGRPGFGGPPSGFGGPPGGFGGPPGGGRSMMDANGDGRLDQNELANMPQGFRDMLQSRGVQLRPGMSVDDFRNTMREQFTRMREEGVNPFDPRSGPSANRSEYSPAAPFRPREKERVTVDLPPKYSELDTDFDGQIGLYEWLTAKRESLDMFDQIDVDADGLLTPRELQSYDETSSADEPKVVKYERERLTIVGGTSTSSGSSRNGSESGSRKDAKREDRQQQEETARRYFGFMDRNRNGKIDMEEWDSSRRLKPQFEEAGIKIEPMSEDEFAKKYAKVMERASRESGGR